VPEPVPAQSSELTYDAIVDSIVFTSGPVIKLELLIVSS
jgi:hypothetical protein